LNPLRSTLVIARRELLERIKSKWFVAVTLLGPMGMVAMMVIPALIASRGSEGARVEIVDKSGVLGDPLSEALQKRHWKTEIVAADTADGTELRRIREKEINGFIVVPADALDGGEIVYRGDNASSQMVSVVLHQTVSMVVRKERGRRAGISEAELESVLEPPHFSAQHTTGETEGSLGIAAFLVGYLVALVLYIAITLYGVAVMRSVVQEKTSRVMELMVAAAKPHALMAGKILGVGAAGLLQLSAWLGMGAITVAYRGAILGAFGASGAGPSLPPIAFTEVAVVLAFFVVGFFFYSSLYAAAGALVSSEQDSQQVQMPVTMMLVVGVMCLQVVSDDPRGPWAQTLTMLPMWSPMLMPMRFVLGGASLWEVALSLAILIASTLLVPRHRGFDRLRKQRWDLLD